MLARTGLAWLGMMQIMMFAFPGYLRSAGGSADALASLDRAIVLMNWISLVLTVPVVLYCAWPVWQGAWRRLARFEVGMDVPVALSIITATIPSALSTWRGSGEVYFDSVSMFVAFLLTARYLEMCARQAAGDEQCDEKPDTRGLIDSANRLAFWFVLIQVALAAIVGLYWLNTRPEHALAVTVALLVMSCPCAMAMAVPTAVAARRAMQLRGPGLTREQGELMDRAMVKVAHQNLYGSLAWHVLMTPLAALGWVQPWLAALTMLVSSLAVAANAWRFYRQSRAHGALMRPGLAAGGVDGVADALFLLLPVSLLFVVGIGVAFWWAIFAGQFDDTQEAASAILDDDDSSF
jgi:cbb3-type cytochrome oxidase maturation protein